MRSAEQATGKIDAETAWRPTPADVSRSNIAAAMRELALSSYEQLHRYSVEQREAYWGLVIRRLGVRFRRPAQRILDPDSPATKPRWLPGARLNIVESCFQSNDDQPAVIYGGRAGLVTLSYGELRAAASRIAAGLAARGIGRGDCVAFLSPLSPQAIAAYLGTIWAGAAAVSIAESFSPAEIAVRLKIAKARLIFTCGVMHRAGKEIDLYEKVRAASGPPAIIMPELASAPAVVPQRSEDCSYDNFLQDLPSLPPVECDPQDPIGVLFSSGTTGEPKAIVWDHTTPLKCASDIHFHHDLHPGEVACWPTSLGWMMGPWLILGTLMNRGVIAVYDDAPTLRGFGEFVRDARVNMLGVIPSLVRTWRHSRCMEGIDFSSIRLFSTTGECSNPHDMRYLMQLAGGKPVIEYCGGTELAGGYVACTVVQPLIPSAFSTPTLGLDFVLRDEEGRFGRRGEVFLIGPSIGMSTRLLNHENDEVYYRGTPPGPNGELLRRHGDQLEMFADGYYRVIGRCDDTMNLGGIKVGCGEIERVVAQLPQITEVAAIAVPPPDGGPSQLVICAARRAGDTETEQELREAMQALIRRELNPLFKIHAVRLLPALPRTASNKILRRELRRMCEGREATA